MAKDTRTFILADLAGFGLCAALGYLAPAPLSITVPALIYLCCNFAATHLFLKGSFELVSPLTGRISSSSGPACSSEC